MQPTFIHWANEMRLFVLRRKMILFLFSILCEIVCTWFSISHKWIDRWYLEIEIFALCLMSILFQKNHTIYYWIWMCVIILHWMKFRMSSHSVLFCFTTQALLPLESRMLHLQASHRYSYRISAHCTHVAPKNMLGWNWVWSLIIDSYRSIISILNQ